MLTFFAHSTNATKVESFVAQAKQLKYKTSFIMSENEHE